MPGRRVVLAVAVVAGLAAGALLDPSDRRDARPPDLTGVLVSIARAQPAPPAVPEPPAPAPKADGSGGQDRAVDAEITIDQRGVVIRKGGDAAHGDGDAHVIIGDHEFDSFEEFVEQAPWLAGLVFMVTSLVFITPLLVIGLVIWYKMRRTRMMNETMLKLAERGVVPPADAMEAIATGRPGPALQNVPPSAPLYEQAQALRKRAAWSDLRKGVLVGGVGLGLTLFSMFDDGSANGFGLVLLFVGMGYALLWYLEERPAIEARNRAGAPPPGGA